jgi:hypothetical protein
MKDSMKGTLMATRKAEKKEFLMVSMKEIDWGYKRAELKVKLWEMKTVIAMGLKMEMSLGKL